MGKIISKNEVEEIKELKKQGKKIVLCHGVFDLVHPGHIIHFQEANQHHILEQHPRKTEDTMKMCLTCQFIGRGTSLHRMSMMMILKSDYKPLF